MKITPPSLPPARVPFDVATPTDGAGASFEQLLEAPDALRRERQERAFGFSELGILNAHGSISAAAMPRPPQEVDGPKEPRSSDVAPPAVPQQTSAVPVTTPNPIRVSPHAEGSPGAPGDRALHATPAPTVTSVNEPAPSEWLPSRDDEAPAAERAERLRPPAPTQSKALKLAIFEQNGAIQVVAGAPGLNSEDRARLRRAATAVAAEFGLSIESLTLNGLDAEPPSFTPIGESHGDHRG